jgi:hypothetical protein
VKKDFLDTGLKLTSRSLIMPLTEDREKPHLCPVKLFLSLIFADNVFPDDLHPHHLFNSDFSREVIELLFKESMLDVPIFRMSMSSTKGWSYAGCHGAFVAFQERFGHEGVTEYAFRRGAVNLILGWHYPSTFPFHILVKTNEHSEYNRSSGNEDFRPRKDIGNKEILSRPSRNCRLAEPFTETRAYRFQRISGTKE